MRFLREMLRPFSFRWPVGGTLQMTKAGNAGEARRLDDIPNIGPGAGGARRRAYLHTSGPAVGCDLRDRGIEQPGQLAGKDPDDLYERLGAVTGVRHDPGVIDTFISAVRFMEGAPPYPWWHYTPERKRHLAAARR